MRHEIRIATGADIPAISALIPLSVRELQRPDYTEEQREAALRQVYGVDTQLIDDGTYFVVEGRATDTGPLVMAACGGWSKRRTLFGGDHYARREDGLLDPRVDAAKIRAFFVHPEWARRGIGSLVLDACERAAHAAGFTRFEMGATLTGVPFYHARGYVACETIQVPLGERLTMPVVRMTKEVVIRAPA